MILLQYYINRPDFITRLCLLPKLFSKLCFVFHACTFDDLMTNEKSFRSEIRDTSKNVADTIFNHLIGCKCPEFRNGFWNSYSFQTDFRKWLFETLCLDSRFNNHPDSVILQKCQSLSNQIFKHNLVHTSSLNLTPSLFLTFITQKANACSSWTPCCTYS